MEVKFKKENKRKDFILAIFSLLTFIAGILSFIFLSDQLQIIFGFSLLSTSIITSCYLKCSRDKKVNYIQV